MTPATPSQSKRDYIFGGVILAIVFCAMLYKSWRRWPGFVVDYGLQLYMPWQISKGAVMYRDFFYMVGGPLSQHYHALLFKVFGVAFITIAISNLILIVLFSALVYHLFYKCADQLTAITVGMSFVLVFAFANYTTFGIFNYVTPYCAEVVHGVMFSALGTALLALWVQTANPRFAAGTGLCAGLTLLTKPELFVSAVVVIGAGFFLFWRLHRQQQLMRSLGYMVIAGIVPGSLFFLWFLSHGNIAFSAKAVFAAWVPLLTTSAADSPYYKWCLGLDNPPMHLSKMATQTAWLAGILIVAAFACSRKIPLWLSIVFATALAYRSISILWNVNLFSCGYSLPPLCLALLAVLLWRGFRNGWDKQLIFVTLWTIWSLATLAKLGLFCRIWHYGFVLAMPAFLAGVYFLLWELPMLLEKWSVNSKVLKSFMWALVFTSLLRTTQASLVIYEDKTLPVATGGDLIYGFSVHFKGSDKIFSDALAWVETNASPTATMAVLPQGAILNYLSRHTNPSGYAAWNPPEVTAFGQRKMTDALEKSSPDYVVEVAVNYSEYDEKYFGTTDRLGLEAQKWIEANYDEAILIGHDWLKDNQFGLRIYRKKGLLHADAARTLRELPARFDFADRADF